MDLSYKILVSTVKMIMLMQERGSRETESEGSVAKDCLEGRDNDNGEGAKSVQPKTPVLRKVVEEDKCKCKASEKYAQKSNCGKRQTVIWGV